MKAENIEKAKKLCHELDHVNMKLDTLVDERDRNIQQKTTSGTVRLFEREPFDVGIKTYQSVLSELISDYQVQKDLLLKQIEQL